MTVGQARILIALSQAKEVHIDAVHHDFHQTLIDFSLMDPPLLWSSDGNIELTEDGRLAAQRLRWGVPG